MLSIAKARWGKAWRALAGQGKGEVSQSETLRSSATAVRGTPLNGIAGHCMAMAKLSGASRCKAQRRNGLAQRSIARSGIAKARQRVVLLRIARRRQGNGRR